MTGFERMAAEQRLYKILIAASGGVVSTVIALAVGTSHTKTVLVVFGLVVVALWMVSPRQLTFPNATAICPDMTGKYCLVSGPTSGIGIETAKTFLLKNAQMVILTARSEQKLRAVKKDLISAHRVQVGTVEESELDKRILCLKCDLGDLNSVRECTSSVKTLNLPHLDVVVCNAGIMGIPERTETKQGLEQQMGVCHVGHQYLVSELASELQKANNNQDPARVVVLSSAGHAFTDPTYVTSPVLEGEQAYHPKMNYGNAKFANILFAKELHKRYCRPSQTSASSHRPVVAFSVHPGGILTGLQDDVPLWPTYLAWCIIAPFVFKSTMQGAATSVHCATRADPDVDGGCYFEDCQKSVGAEKGFPRILQQVRERLSSETEGWESDLVGAAGALQWRKTEELLKTKGF